MILSGHKADVNLTPFATYTERILPNFSTLSPQKKRGAFYLLLGITGVAWLCFSVWWGYSRQWRPFVKNQLLIAIHTNDPRRAELFLALGAPTNPWSHTYKKTTATISPLELAVLEGHPNMVQLLLRHHADPNSKGSMMSEGTPLHTAVFKGDLIIATILLNNGADVNAEDNVGAKPLWFAAWDGNVRLCTLLLDHGASLSAGPVKLRPALFAVAWNNHADVGKLLIDRGADVNEPFHDGSTALFSAARRGHKEFTQLLLEHGAEINTINNEGRTALDAVLEEEEQLKKSDKKSKFDPDPKDLETSRQLLLNHGAKRGNELVD